MTEWDAIRRTKTAVTRSTMVRDLRQLGLKEGMTVIVHTSMSRIGWICGGPVAVIEALQEVLTPAGTLIMPAHSADVSDPIDWENPPVPKKWMQAIYQEMPPFDPERTPTLGMGRVAETFRKFPGVRRSSHPIYSFAAWGAACDQIVDGHVLDDGLGQDSPLAKIYQLNGWVLLLGVSYGNNTSMHLGECCSKKLKMITRQSPILLNGQRRWVSYRDWDYHEERFSQIGHAFETDPRETKNLQIGKIGQADSLFMSQRAIVDFTANFLKQGPVHRSK
ncbi:aminoglycoside N(3)-acetyltransferase [Sporolactobacillus pectinivorans]|uniref:aminoglycoside N(3)-acetyltransferase n=1 Tax=Sporolactobacillus pectinivorans TaxID=1591408 RepID=UPI000C268FE0|nr:AAC(3) family N-acetyltransferase [Sporolactobacillus pectinivorans]